MKEKHIKITLTKNEARISAITGLERRLESLYKGYHGDVVGNDSNYKTKSWDYEINGAAAEMATAKYLKRYWCAGVNTFKDPDIGKHIQVRHTDNKDGNLIIRNNDDPKYIYIMVTGKIPTFKIIGWILGKVAQKPEWWGNKGKGKSCWWVPQNALNDFTEPIEKVVEKMSETG